MQFGNKRIRPEEIDWVQEHFKEPKLRVLLYLQLGIDECNITKEKKRVILETYESRYDKIRITHPVTKAAYMLKEGLKQLGYSPTNKWVTGIYNLASNVLSHK